MASLQEELEEYKDREKQLSAQIEQAQNAPFSPTHGARNAHSPNKQSKASKHKSMLEEENKWLQRQVTRAIRARAMRVITCERESAEALTIL